MSHDRATFDAFTYIGPDPYEMMQQRMLRVGGRFLTEDVALRSGRTYSRLAPGSGGAMCVPRGMMGQMYASQCSAWRAVHTCTPLHIDGSDPRAARPAPPTPPASSHIRALRPHTR